MTKEKLTTDRKSREMQLWMFQTVNHKLQNIVQNGVGLTMDIPNHVGWMASVINVQNAFCL